MSCVIFELESFHQTQSVRQMILSIISYANTNISRAQEFFWLNHPQMDSIRRRNGKIKNSMGATPNATNPNFRRESSFQVFLHICSISAKTAENFGMRPIFYKKSIKLRFVWYMVDVGRSNVARLMTSQSQFFFKKMGPPPTVWALVPTNGLPFLIAHTQARRQ